jgi:hypothetical protein
MLGSVVGLFSGAALLRRPEWMLRVSRRANRWVSTRQLARPLVRTIILDGWFYRYNRFSGVLLMSGSIYIVYFFTTVFDKTGALNNAFKTASVPPALMAGLLDAMVLCCLMGAVFAAMISLFLIYRPSMLREFEQRANQKISLRQVLKPLEKQHDGLDQYVFRNVRLVGILILLGSSYTLIILASSLKSIWFFAQ